MSTTATSVFSDPEVAEDLSTILDNYGVFAADKALTNIVLICKRIRLG